MARRIIEEDVTTTPSTTVVESDGSWVGRTIVALVAIAVLVAGAIWLFGNMGDGNNNNTPGDNQQNEVNVNPPAEDPPVENPIPNPS